MKKVLKFAGLLLIILLVLAGTAYVVGSSQWFIKGQVLPRVAAAIGAPVTVDGVAFSPLASLEVTGLCVGDPAHPLAAVTTLRVRYDALAVFGKKIVVSELLVDGAKFTLEQKADGTWNLPSPPAAAQTPGPAKNAAPGPFPYALDLRNLRIVNAELVFQQSKPAPTTVTVRNLNLTIPAVQPGKPFEAVFAALVTAARNGETLADQMPVTVHATMPGLPEIGKLPEAFEVQLRAGDAVTVEPASTRAPTGRAVSVTLHVAPVANGRQCTVSVSGRLAKESPANEFDFQVTGTSGTQPFPMTLTINAALAPAPSTLRALAKLPLAPFTGSYTGTVALASADKISATGSLTLDHLGLADSATGPKLPPLSLALQHDVALDLAASSATVSGLAGRVVQNGRDLVSVTLSAPATVAWGSAKGPEASPAKLAVVIKNLDIASLAPFLPATLPVAVTGGTFNAEAGLVIEKQGAAIAFDVSVAGDDLRLRQGGRDLPVFSCRQHVTGTLAEFRKLTAQAQGSVSLPTGNDLPALQAAATLAATANLADAAGTLEKCDVQFKQSDRMVVTAAIAAPIALTWGAPAGFAAGDADLRLTVDALGLTLANGFLPPSVPRLKSGTLGAAITARLTEKGAMLRASGDWAVQDLRLAAGDAAITVKNAFDLAFLPKSRELRIMTCALTAQQGDTPVADLAITAGIVVLPPFDNRPMALTLTSTNLNLLAIKELSAKFAGKTAAVPAPSASPAPAAEPPPVDFKGLRATLSVSLKKVTYGDLAVTDLVTALEVKDNTIIITPSALVLNGAPTTFRGTANLGAAPWTYDLAATLDTLAIAPLVNSFSPTVKDRISGEVKHVAVSAAGIGVTPDNLSRNFKGGATFEARNLHIQNVRQFITDAVEQKAGLKSVAELITTFGIGDLQQLVFDSAKINLDAAGGRLQVKEGVITGPDLLITSTAGDSIGFDQTLNLNLRAGFGGALEKHIRSLQLGALLGPREDDHAMFVKAIAIRGTFANPDTSGLEWKKLLRDIGKDKALDAGKSIFQDLLKGGKIDKKKLRGTLLNEPAPASPSSTASATPAAATAPVQPAAAAQAPAQVQEQPPVTPTPTSAPPERSKKKKNRDALFEFGAGLLNGESKK
jgi:hypothetical protein